MTTLIPLAEPGVASFDVSDTFVTAELFNSAVPAPVTEDFPFAAGAALAVYAVVGLDADGNLTMGTADHSRAIAATGALTFTGAGSATETITVGAVTYTLRAAVGVTANEVKIGASAADTAANLIAAVNGSSGAGTLYGSATAANPDVKARSGGAGIAAFVARVAGVAGNALATTETSAVAAFSNATLSGGMAQIGAEPIGILVAGLAATASASRAPVYRQGNFNPTALVWHASFDTDAKKAAAFRSAPTPTNILIRKRL